MFFLLRVAPDSFGKAHHPNWECCDVNPSLEVFDATEVHLDPPQAVIIVIRQCMMCMGLTELKSGNRLKCDWNDWNDWNILRILHISVLRTLMPSPVGSSCSSSETCSAVTSLPWSNTFHCWEHGISAASSHKTLSTRSVPCELQWRTGNEDTKTNQLPAKSARIADLTGHLFVLDLLQSTCPPLPSKK